MKLNNISKEELETMNYDDIAYLILKEEKTKMKINLLFQKVCEVLELNENAYIDKITDFFELLTTDKRFIMLEDGSWDLKELHNTKVVVDDEDDDTLTSEVEDDEDSLEDKTDEEEDNDNLFYDSDSDDDLPDDDLDDLVVIDVDEEEANS